MYKPYNINDPVELTYELFLQTTPYNPIPKSLDFTMVPVHDSHSGSQGSFYHLFQK
jgi:hypothetical protein